MPNAIEVRELTRRFGPFTAVDNVSFAVREGSIYGYLGLNGAGKSTTIKMLATLLGPTSGSARVAGHDVVADPLSVRREIGLLSDEATDSRPHWTAREYLSYFAHLHAVSDPAGRIEQLLDLVALEPAWRSRLMETYSTGMKRRVQLARALLGKPRVLFLDEPTRGLDLPAKREVWDFLRELVRREGVTIFLSSHEVHEIHVLCEDLSVIARGRLTYTGPAAALGADIRAFEDSLIRLLRGEAPRMGDAWGRKGASA